MRTRIGACAAIVLSLAACGNPAPAPQEKTSATDTAAATTETAAPAAPAQAGETPDACTLVTTDELATIFPGRSFALDNTSPEKRNKPGGPRRNAITSCTYVSTGASISDMMTISVVLTTAYSDKAQPTLQQMQSGLSTLGVKFKGGPIEGVGDAGYWYNAGGDRRSAVVVNIMRNPRYWLNVSESSSGQEEAVTVSRLTDVAKTALGRM
jgi:hypothetical protein